jgi:hypothetical protein
VIEFHGQLGGGRDQRVRRDRDDTQATPAETPLPTPAWALGHPEKVIDFGHRGIHQMTLRRQSRL